MHRTRPTLRSAAWATAAALSVFTAASHAAPTQWSAADGGNDHWYEVRVVSPGLTWEQAQSEARASGGYLATLTSAAENAFVFKLADRADAWVPNGAQFGEMRGPWLGGFQPPGSQEPYGGWQWVNDEGSFNYTAWLLANNFGGDESVIEFYGLNNLRQPLWNDEGALVPNISYVVEWSTAPVPEPQSALLMLSGIGVLSLLVRRARA